MKQEAIYRIKIDGYLDKNRAELFENMDMVLLQDGKTLLQGLLKDQAMLYGVLRKMRDLGLTLLSLERKEIEDLKEIPLRKRNNDKEQVENKTEVGTMQI